MRTRYTVVIQPETTWDEAGKAETEAWFLRNVDTRVLSLIDIVRSVFQPHFILTCEGEVDEYTQSAFEAALNYEMRDPTSEVIWWNKSMEASG